jgi:bla regulator protein BlaR1
MQTLFNQYSQVLGITLLHSLWQGLIIYALLRIILLCIPSATSANKYNVALLALTASVLWPIITLLIEISKQQPITSIIDTTFEPLNFVPLTHTNTVAAPSTWSVAIDHYMPYLVVLWFIGIIINSARLLWEWRNIYQIKQTLINDPAFQESVQLIAQLLQIPQKVQVFLSDHIDVPCIIGYLKPMVILPTAIITQFSAEQIKSILVHEMAHIRRNDYIINVLQQFIGILFFFNPFTHLINKIIYNEREHSCDDLVLQVTGEPLVYAQTLLQLEENRNQNLQLALAVTGKKYHLLNRIKRIMETKKQVNNIRHILAAVLLLLGSMGTIAWLNPEIKDGKVTITPAGKLPFLSNLADSTKKAATKTKHSGSRTVPGKIAFPKPKSANLTAKSYDYNDPQLDKLSAEIDKHSQAISKYYDSDEFKKMQSDLDKKSAEIQAYFDKRETKELQEKQDKYSQEFQSKWGNADEQDVIYMKYLALFKEFSKYMFTPEYKELDKSLQAKYDIKPVVDPQYPRMHMLDQKNKNYPAYQKELNESAPENVKKLRTEMDDLQKQRKVYNKSPDEQNRELRTLADSMRKTFNNPQIQQTELEMKKLGEAMRAYQNNPEIKKEQELLKASAEKLKAYTNSLEFKKQMEQMKKVEVFRYNKVEKTEKPEKLEKPEKEEKPEQIENN